MCASFTDILLLLLNIFTEFPIRGLKTAATLKIKHTRPRLLFWSDEALNYVIIQFIWGGILHIAWTWETPTPSHIDFFMHRIQFLQIQAQTEMSDNTCWRKNKPWLTVVKYFTVCLLLLFYTIQPAAALCNSANFIVDVISNVAGLKMSSCKAVSTSSSHHKYCFTTCFQSGHYYKHKVFAAAENERSCLCWSPRGRRWICQFNLNKQNKSLTV